MYTALVAIVATALAIATPAFADDASSTADCRIHATPGSAGFDPERGLIECMGLAKAGDAEAAWMLCGLYGQGFVGDGQDLEQAALWCKAAGDRRHAAASRQYANMLLDGLGVPTNSRLALTWMRRAADYGSTNAVVDLEILKQSADKDRPSTAKIYFDGAQKYLHAEPPMTAPALKWMQRSADLGFDVAQLTCGRMLLDGGGLPAPQPRMAAHYLQMAVRQGNAEAMYYLAALVLKHSDDENELVSAVRLLSSAVDRKVPQALALYGKMLQSGDRVNRDAQAGTNMLREAAELGLKEAMLLYGFSLYEGVGIAQDRNLAVSWIGRAAEANTLDAQAELGRIYKEDQTLGNIDLARKWLEMAAGSGSTDADILLGKIEEDPTFGEVDDKAAKEWFIKAAESGDARGALALAEHYKRTGMDSSSAYKWANIAASMFPNNSVAAEARKLRKDLSMSIKANERYELALEGFKWLQAVSPRRYSEALPMKN